MKKLIYIAMVSIMLFSCGKKSKDTPEVESTNENEILVTKAQFESSGMQLGTTSEQEFEETVKTNGFLDLPPQNRASIRTFVGGYVKSTPLLIGDKVKKGQPLVTLENTEYIAIQQEYLEVTEQLSYLNSEYSRQKKLFEENITSQKNYLKAESEYKRALAMHNGLKSKLEMMNINTKNVENGNISSSITIYSPINGSVSKINAANGVFVSPSDEIMEIINPDHIHLELSVFEKDILKVKKDQNIYFKVPEASNETFEAEVHLVGASINEGNRTVKVHGHLKDETHSFVTGMFVEASIIVDSYKSLALPVEAVIEVDGSNYFLLLKNKTEDAYIFEKKAIKIDKKTETYIELGAATNLKKEDKILVKGAFNLLGE